MKNNRKAVSERQLGILDLIRSRGEARVEELAQIFQTSLMRGRKTRQTSVPKNWRNCVASPDGKLFGKLTKGREPI